MLLTHKISIPLYNQDVWILIGAPYEAQRFLEDMYRADFSFNPGPLDGICLHHETTSYIWLAEDANFPTIIHELSHATFDLMGDVGLKPDDQEAFCYILQFLVEECQNIFAIRMDPIKKV